MSLLSLRGSGVSLTSKDVHDSAAPPLPPNDKNPWLESSTDLADGLDVFEVTDESVIKGLPVPARPPGPSKDPSDA